jgi:hypothetical protein
VRQAPAESVELRNKHRIKLVLPHAEHHHFQSYASCLCSADDIAIFTEIRPTSSAGVFEQFKPLRLGGLLARADSVIKRDSHSWTSSIVAAAGKTRWMASCAPR